MLSWPQTKVFSGRVGQWWEDGQCVQRRYRFSQTAQPRQNEKVSVGMVTDATTGLIQHWAETGQRAFHYRRINLPHRGAKWHLRNHSGLLCDCDVQSFAVTEIRLYCPNWGVRGLYIRHCVGSLQALYPIMHCEYQCTIDAPWPSNISLCDCSWVARQDVEYYLILNLKKWAKQSFQKGRWWDVISWRSR